VLATYKPWEVTYPNGQDKKKKAVQLTADGSKTWDKLGVGIGQYVQNLISQYKKILQNYFMIIVYITFIFN